MVLSNWWKLARGEHGLLVLVGVAASAYFSGSRDAAFMLWAGLGPMLVTWAAFILNDYFDVPTDAALKRTDRPLVSGQIKPLHAKLVAYAFLFFGILQSVTVTPGAFTLCAIFGLLGVLYSMFLKKLPAVGNVFIGFSMAVPMLYGNLALTPSLLPETVLFALSAFLIGFGRELLITLRDVEGDKKVGAKTLPMILGPRWTVRVSAFFLLWGLGMAYAVSQLRVTIPYGFFLGLSTILLCKTILTVFPNPSVPNLKQARAWTLAALACGLLAYVGLAF